MFLKAWYQVSASGWNPEREVSIREILKSSAQKWKNKWFMGLLRFKKGLSGSPSCELTVWEGELRCDCDLLGGKAYLNRGFSRSERVSIS